MTLADRTWLHRDHMKHEHADDGLLAVAAEGQREEDQRVDGVTLVQTWPSLEDSGSEIFEDHQMEWGL